MKHELENLSHRIGYSPPRCGLCFIAPVVAAAAIGAGASIASGAANIVMSNKMNKRSVRQAEKTRAWQTKERIASQNWQERMYGQQLEDTQMLRDYDNWYNSPEQQKQRMLDAGFSPMAALGNMGNSMSSAHPMSAPSAPGDPGASLPQLFNPSGSFGDVADSFSQFAQTLLQDKKTVAEIDNLDSLSSKNAAETATIESLRKGQIQLQGIDIDLKGSQKALSDKQREALAAQIVKTNTEVDVAKQYMSYMGVQMNYVEFQKWLQKQDFDVRSKEVASRIALNMSLNEESKARKVGYNHANRLAGASFDHQVYQMRSQDWRTARENEVLQFYHEHKYGQRQAQFRDMLGEYSIKNIPSDFSIALRQGMQNINAIVEPIGKIFSAYSQFAVGNYYTAKRSQMMSSMFQTGNLMSDPVDGGTFWNTQNW